jgi:hypothetical protein
MCRAGEVKKAASQAMKPAAAIEIESPSLDKMSH